MLKKDHLMSQEVPNGLHVTIGNSKMQRSVPTATDIRAYSTYHCRQRNYSINNEKFIKTEQKLGMRLLKSTGQEE